MINDNIKKGERYHLLDAPYEFWIDLVNNPQKIKDCCNGVGSEVGWFGKLTYHFIPNTIWGLDVTEFSDIHDYMYTYPEEFDTEEDALRYKDMADRTGRHNLQVIISRNSKLRWLKLLRIRRARQYYFLLKIAGKDSFLEGKKIHAGVAQK